MKIEKYKEIIDTIMQIFYPVVGLVTLIGYIQKIFFLLYGEDKISE